MAATLDPFVADPSRDYGSKVVAVEPGGAEFIPLDERHGKPWQLFWTWISPNMEFATIAVGILGPLAFGLNRSGSRSRPSCSARRWARRRTACCRPGARGTGCRR